MATSPSDGISLDFRPEVEMVLELHRTFPAGSCRPCTLDGTIENLLQLIRWKAELQALTILERVEDIQASRLMKAGLK